MGVCSTFHNALDRARDRCFHLVPCLSDPVRRSSLILRVALVSLHLVIVGVLFLFYADLLEKIKDDPWYIGSYAFLFFATLLQYFITSGSSPGYLIDVMRDASKANATNKQASSASKQPASSRDGRLVITVEGGHSGRNLPEANKFPWVKLVMDLYPPGTCARSLTCSYCSLEQPPRAKHCHDCDKCVLQFDHHCVWLGTCIGQGNHSKFWWYICEESALCIWTFILYIFYLKDDIPRAWWKDAVVFVFLLILSICLIFLLLLLLFHSYLILTNQTTYELVRRRRIPYMRNIRERINPFSKGICRNLDNVCCGWGRRYYLEPLPTFFELEEMSRPYTCIDVLKCRCC